MQFLKYLQSSDRPEFFLHKANIYKSVLKPKKEKVIILRYCKILRGGVPLRLTTLNDLVSGSFKN